MPRAKCWLPLSLSQTESQPVQDWLHLALFKITLNVQEMGSILIASQRLSMYRQLIVKDANGRHGANSTNQTKETLEQIYFKCIRY